MILLKDYQMYNKYFKIGFNHHCFYYYFEQLKLLLLKTRPPDRFFLPFIIKLGLPTMLKIKIIFDIINCARTDIICARTYV